MRSSVAAFASNAFSRLVPNRIDHTPPGDTRIIDWGRASLGNPCADVACTTLTIALGRPVEGFTWQTVRAAVKVQWEAPANQGIWLDVIYRGVGRS